MDVIRTPGAAWITGDTENTPRPDFDYSNDNEWLLSCCFSVSSCVNKPGDHPPILFIIPDKNRIHFKVHTKDALTSCLLCALLCIKPINTDQATTKIIKAPAVL